MNSPSLAYLYKGFPLCFKAEKNGGFCRDSPRNLFNSCLISVSFGR